jgi:hypothetical protein
MFAFATSALPAGAAPTWAVVTSPSPPAPTAGTFAAVACPTASRCFAVGGDFGRYSQLESWNGAAWSLAAFPKPAGTTASNLTGIACPAAASCFAVGTAQAGSGPNKTLVEQWNGTSWSLDASPNPAGALNILTAVTCPTATSCFAVGQNQNGSTQKTLIEHWNGTAWAVMTSPNPAGSDIKSLRGVACASATSCFAVGSLDGGPSSSLLVEKWNGSVWSMVTVPSPAGATKARFGGVSCPAATTCFAVGFAETDTSPGRPAKTLVGRWNGSTWAIIASANVAGVNSSVLNGVECSTATACIAVGASSAVTGIVSDTNTLIERWNGSAWSVTASPNPVANHGATLAGIGCATTAHCFAVGTSGGSNLSFTEEWSGSAWSLDAPPTGSSQSQLDGVSCLTATNCYAAGFNETAVGYRTLIEHRDATAWSIQASSNAAGATDNFLYGVACATATTCYAVGVSRAGGVPTALLERLSGSSWAITAIPKPAGSDETTFTGIACPSPTSCFAVGYYEATGNPTVIRPLVEHWNGTAWSVMASPIHTGSSDTEAAGVACSSSTSCFAVGSYLPSSGEATFTMRWNGSTWAAVASPNPHPADRLTAVACASATNCSAVGLAAVSPTTTVTLAEHWNGSAWSTVASPSTNGGESQLLGVSCPAATTCFAVGHDQISTTNPLTRPLIEKWNGTAWTIMTSPSKAGANASEVEAVACSTTILCRAVGFSATAANLHTLVEQYG